MKRSSKATRKQLKRHNLQLLLRAVYSGQADSRAALAQETGLAKPTVSELVGELMDMGLLAEDGRGLSTESGGKRPRLLRFVPDSRQVIGIAVDTYRVLGVLANLDGQTVALHYAEMNGAQGDDAIDLIKAVINGLMAQLDSPLLCIGVGVPGVVHNAAGIVQSSPHLGWHHVALADALTAHYDVPTHVGNNTELAAMAQFTFGGGDDQSRNLVTVLINRNIEIGMALHGAVYHHGSDIGCLTITPNNSPMQRLEDLLGWNAVCERAVELVKQMPQSQLPIDNLTYLDIRYGANHGDPAAIALMDELAGHLAHVFAWAIALLRPDHIALAGMITDAGDRLLEGAVHNAADLLQPEIVSGVTFSLADSSNLSTIGAVANALQKELGIV